MKRNKSQNVPLPETENSETSVSGRRRISIGYLAVAFVAALTLWFYVADYDTIVEKTFTNIPVELIYPTKGDIVVESGEGKLISVTVMGKKADINEMKSEDIRAYVDVSGVTKDGEFDAVIIVELPNDITLVENNALSVTHIMVSLAVPTSKQLDVEVKIVGGQWADIYDLYPECEPGKIEITGAKSIVERVAHAYVNIDVGEIERPVQMRGKIELVDDNGDTVPQNNLKIENNGNELTNSTVEIYVRMETEKELPVKVEFTGGVFTESDAIISCTPSTVIVRGGVEKLRKMEYLSIPIDETTLGNSFVGSVALPELDDTLEYISQEEKIDVSISFRDIQTVTLTMTTEDITVKGLPEGLAARLQFIPGENGLVPSSADITVRGYRETIIDLRRERLELLDISVDFTEFADSETGVQLGQKYASLEVTITFKDLQGVFTTDRISVSAEIIEVQDDNDAD